MRRLAWSGLLVLLAAFAACSSDWVLSTDPVAVYRAYFRTPLSSVRILKSGGNAHEGRDAWLKISCQRDVALAEQPLYRAAKPGGMRREFQILLPRDKDLSQDGGAWLCLTYTDTGLDHPNGRALLFKRGSGVYFFHAWERR